MTTGSSGKDNPSKMQRFRFQCYADFSLIKLSGQDLPSTLFDQIRNGINSPGSVKAISKQWLYIFMGAGDSASLKVEAYAEQPGVFKVVDWSPAKQSENYKTYPRNLKSTTQTEFLLDISKPHYAFLTSYPLKLTRITEYTKNINTLKKRSVVIPNKCSTPLTTIHIPLVEDCTRYVAGQYHTRRDQLDPSHHCELDQKKMMLALMTQAIYSSPSQAKYKKYLTPPKKSGRKTLDQWIKGNQAISATRIALCKHAELRLAKLKLEGLYEQWFADLKGIKDAEARVLELENEFTSPEELYYFQELAKDPDCWYFEFAYSDEFLVIRKTLSTAASEDLFPVLSKAFIVTYMSLKLHGKPKGLQLPTNAKRAHPLDELCLAMNQVLKKLDPASIPFQQIKANVFFQTAVLKSGQRVIVSSVISIELQIQIHSPNAHERKAAKSTIRSHFEKVNKIAGPILAVVELINLTSTIAKDNNTGNPYYRDTINLIGSCMDMVGSLEFLAKKSSKGSAVLGTKIGARVFPLTALIGAFADGWGASFAIADAVHKRDHGALVGQSLIFASSGVTFGVAFAAIAAGTAPSGPGMVIALGLFLVGSGIVWLFSEEELESYAEICPWGCDGLFNIDQATLTQVSGMLDRLYNILSQGSCKVRLYCQPRNPSIHSPGFIDTTPDYTYYIWILINPNMFFKAGSIYHLKNFKIYRENWLGEDVILNFGHEKFVDPANTDIIINETNRSKYKPELLELIIPQKKFSKPVHPENVDGDSGYKYSFSLQLITDGFAFPEKPVKFEGKLESTKVYYIP